jgi:H+/Cl- antiporter ClcA
MDYIIYLMMAIGIGLSAWVAIKQKPWWELTREEKKKRLPFMIAVLLLVILGIVAFIIVK